MHSSSPHLHFIIYIQQQPVSADHSLYIQQPVPVTPLFGSFLTALPAFTLLARYALHRSKIKTSHFALAYALASVVISDWFDSPHLTLNLL